MYILGISCYYHDSSAALLKDGIIVAAAEEERFTRKKHDTSFPIKAINYCLESQGIKAADLEYVGFYEKPFLKFERALFQHLHSFPKSLKTFVTSMPSWINQKLRVIRAIRKQVTYKGDVLFIEHHLAHAASSFLVSPFKAAAILTVDGVGEWTTTTIGAGLDNEITLGKEIKFPHSIGLLYSTITAYLGFSVNNSEYKVMGLAPFGDMNRETNPFYKKMLQVIDIKDDGSYRLDMQYFKYHYTDRMPSDKLCELLGGPVADRDIEMTERHKDIAAALQLVTEDAILKMINHIYDQLVCCESLVLGGGCALNSVFNGKILKNTKFKNIWIQPNASDGGTSIGVASYIYHTLLGHPRNYVMKDAYLGPSFSTEEIKKFLDSNGIKYSVLKDVVKTTAKLIHEKNVVGWFQGRMEWGPRALGARSILADPCNPDAKELLNTKVKHRECYDDETSILTSDGWILFKDLKGNEKVATLNPENNALEYQTIKKKTEYNFTGYMNYFKNKSIDLLVTPEHKIWAKKITSHQKGTAKANAFGFEEARTLLKKEHVQRKGIDKWVGKEVKYFSLPKIEKSKYDKKPQVDKISMDVWLEFLGHYLADGCFTYDQGHHYIYVACRKTSRKYEIIKKSVENLDPLYKWNYNSNSFRVSNKQLFEYVKQFGKAPNKFIPQEFLGLSERQLKILFDALMRTDGTKKGKQYKYTTVSKRFADNVQELALKLGYSVTTSLEIKENPKHNDVYYVRINGGSKTSWVRKEQCMVRWYDGKVYCVEVPKYRILCVKRGEKVVFSGNSFRPFAPVVCEDDALEYFDCDEPVPLPTDFMLMVYPIFEKWHSKIPSVTHVDGSGRLQTIRKEQNPPYYGVIKEFGKLSGIPILINTSFNIRGEPIVCTPYDAYKCMMGTGVDCLVMDMFLIKREDNLRDEWDSEHLARD